MKVPFIHNIVEVLLTFFPQAINGQDFQIFDDGCGEMTLETPVLELPSLPELLAVSERLALHAEKVRANMRIADFARDKRALIAGTSDVLQVAGWANKQRIAMAVLAGTASDGDKEVFLAEIALRAVEGETLELFTKKVIRNATFFGYAGALTDGLARKAKDSVAAAQSVAEVGAVLEAMRAQAEAAFESLMQQGTK